MRNPTQCFHIQTGRFGSQHHVWINRGIRSHTGLLLHPVLNHCPIFSLERAFYSPQFAHPVFPLVLSPYNLVLNFRLIKIQQTCTTLPPSEMILNRLISTPTQNHNFMTSFLSTYSPFLTGLIHTDFKCFYWNKEDRRSIILYHSALSLWQWYPWMIIIQHSQIAIWAILVVVCSRVRDFLLLFFL